MVETYPIFNPITRQRPPGYLSHISTRVLSLDLAEIDQEFFYGIELSLVSPLST
jgi:hypothetical protein